MYQAMELRDGAISLAAGLFLPDAPGPHPGVLIAPGGLGQGDVEAYRWAAEGWPPRATRRSS